MCIPDIKAALHSRNNISTSHVRKYMRLPRHTTGLNRHTHLQPHSAVQNLVTRHAQSQSQHTRQTTVVSCSLRSVRRAVSLFTSCSYCYCAMVYLHLQHIIVDQRAHKTKHRHEQVAVSRRCWWLVAPTAEHNKNSRSILVALLLLLL